jgi:hypothetical protein
MPQGEEREQMTEDLLFAAGTVFLAAYETVSLCFSSS